MALLACQQLPGSVAKKLFQARAAADGSAQEVDPDVQALAAAFYRADKRKARNERIALFLSIGSFCVAATGVWLMWRRTKADESRR